MSRTLPPLLLVAALAGSLTPDARAAPVRAAPSRVISLIPSVTDLMVALGARERLVARTDYDIGPDVSSLPSIGGTTNPSLEHILTLRPDWVIVWRNPADEAIEAHLTKLGVPFERFGTETLAELHQSIGRLGVVLGLQRSADSLRLAIDDSLTSIRRLVSGRLRPRVLLLLGLDPLRTAGPGTFIDEVLSIAGGRNIFDDVPIRWPVVSLEAVIDRRPALIVWARPGARGPALETLRRRRGWSELAAVRAGRVIVVDRELFNRPGPRIAVAARVLAEAIVASPCGGDETGVCP